MTVSTFRNITLAIFPTSKVKVIKTYLLSNPVQVPVEQSSEERREHKEILMITGVFGVKQWLLNGPQYYIQVQYECHHPANSIIPVLYIFNLNYIITMLKSFNINE